MTTYVIVAISLVYDEMRERRDDNLTYLYRAIDRTLTRLYRAIERTLIDSD